MADLTNQLQAAAGASTGVASDTDFENTVLLLHGDGTNGAQNNTFIDSSTNNFTITRNGNTTQGTFSPFSKPDGRWGNFFDGSGDYLGCGSNNAFAMGTGDFTWEAWIYFGSGSSYRQIFSTRPSSGASSAEGSLAVNPSNGLTWWTSGFIIDYTTSIGVNQWVHVAISRSGTTLRVFANGVQVGSATNSENLTGNGFTIGANGNGSEAFNGYISNVRVVKGTAVYTAAFTPPTTPLTAITNTSLLTCQSNRFKDNSSNNFAITANGDVKVTPFSPFPITTAYSTSVNGGAGYFDGSGDYITAANNSAFEFGTGNFTVECWAYVTSYTPTAADVIVSTYQNSTTGWTIGIQNSVFYGAAAGDSAQINSSVGPNAGWNHLVLVRSGTTLSFFVNGVRAGTQTNSTNMTTTSALTIGTNVGGGTLNFFGYVSGLRIVKGTAVYDPTQTTLTVPTAPPTAITNTSLLCNFTNAGIFDNTGFNALETVGDAQIDTTTKKYGTGSMEFDGTGDYLMAVHSPDQNMGGGNWTGECWVYVTTKNNSVFFAKGPNVWEYFFGYDGATLKMFYGGGSSTSLTDNITLNTWTHVALVRNGSTITAYVNGSSVGSATYTGTYTSTNNLGIGGAIPLLSSGFVMKGYIDDLRITKGIARYTSNFTAPTKAFEDIGA
jgi:hypothetical protein